MRLARLAGGSTGIVVDVANSPVIVEIADAVEALGADAPDVAQLHRWFLGTQSWLPLIADWSSARPLLNELIAQCVEDQDKGRDRIELLPLATTPLAPPLPDPAARIFASGGNFAQHAQKMDAQLVSIASPGTLGASPPWGFYVIPGTVVGPGATVTPPVGTQRLDYEAEVAVVFGEPQARQGHDGVVPWGYTSWDDFSIRDTALGLSQTDHGPLTWSLTKNFQTGNSCGPFMVVEDDLAVDDLRIRCWVNGELRQDGSTDDMIYSFDQTAQYISQYIPLSAGDMVLSGTPAGTAMESGLDGPFLGDGDRVDVLVEGNATLSNVIKMSS